MKSRRDEHAFWARGKRQALLALRDKYKAQVETLEARLMSARDPMERKRLEGELARIRAELAANEKALRWVLF